MEQVAEEQPWMTAAACRGLDPELFFPERGASTACAKAVCANCVVRLECLDYAMENRINIGIFGGKSARQRRKLRAHE